MTLALSGPELAGVTALWAAQKHELLAAFSGTSMLPTIAPGQRVLVRFGAPALLGQIAAYQARDQLFVHRVVAQSSDGRWLLTWGDGNPLPDGPITPEQIVGIVERIETESALREVPAWPQSFFRRLVLRLLVRSADSPIESVAGRVSLIYRLRANANPRVFSATLARRLFG